ncbi:phosphopantetheine-containing protein [Frankia sp. CpI1-P]|uniref:acyl carrier protein n=1 Tax=unclassified Frankia TaxID=2632575 RepID=UPI0007008EF0|nr:MULTISPECIES: phosphopantetheine-binding protein [unclassified Frankia]KQM02623.1 phosphopantetheine-containing protein [Frankia sp. CpI1-P]
MTHDDELSGTLLAEIGTMIARILEKYGLGDVRVEMTTAFHDDLEMESIDLVTLGGMLAERYGENVSLAEFLAEKDLTEVIALTVGDVVEFVRSRLGAPAGVD